MSMLRSEALTKTYVSGGHEITVLRDITFELATGGCPTYLTEVFREGHTPSRVCHLHGGYDSYGPEQSEERRRWQWLRKIFGKKDSGKNR